MRKLSDDQTSQVDTGSDKKQIKVTKANVKTLPDGVYVIAEYIYLRKREGRGTYFLRIKVDGVRHDVNIGSMRKIDPADARVMGNAIKANILKGDRPWEKKSDQNKNILFKDFWEDALKTYASAKKWADHEKKFGTMVYRMKEYILPKIGNVRVRNMTRDHVLDVIKPMWMERPSLADSLRLEIEMIMGMAVIYGMISENPARFRGNIEYFLPSAHKLKGDNHLAAATFDQTKEIVKQCLMFDASCGKKAVLALILTGRRLSEVTGSKWEEFDFENMVWKVPDARMKIKRGYDRRVPMSRQFADLIRSIPKKDGPYVFGKYGKCKMSQQSVTNALRSMICGVTAHGFRSVFIGWCAENQIGMEVAEMCLDHQVGSKVRQAYQRSDLLDQRREVLQRYADALCGVK